MRIPTKEQWRFSNNYPDYERAQTPKGKVGWATILGIDNILGGPTRTKVSMLLKDCLKLSAGIKPGDSRNRSIFHLFRACLLCAFYGVSLGALEVEQVEHGLGEEDTDNMLQMVHQVCFAAAEAIGPEAVETYITGCKETERTWADACKSGTLTGGWEEPFTISCGNFFIDFINSMSEGLEIGLPKLELPEVVDVPVFVEMISEITSLLFSQFFMVRNSCESNSQ